MKSIRSRLVVHIGVLGLLAGMLAAGVLRAQQPSPATAGEFTLPFETRWGKAVLPPGDYSFTVSSPSQNVALVTVRGKKQSVVVMTSAIDTCEACGSSTLFLYHRGALRTVQALRLASLGIVLYYAPRPLVKEILAQTPKSVERVPVLAAKK